MFWILFIKMKERFFWMKNAWKMFRISENLHKSSCGNIHSVSDTFCHMYTKEKNHKLHMSTFKTSIILQSKILLKLLLVCIL